MELRQLRYFVTVGNLSSITQAAKKLHTSQPNITTAIQKLEKELGISLFTRRQKRLYLTPEGERFRSRIEVALGQIKDAVEEVSETSRLQRGKIYIGIPPSIGAAIFPAMLSQFTDLYPGIEIAVLEEGTWLIRSKLEEGELDMGMMILEDVSPKLSTAFITRQQIMVCLPADHPLAGQTSIRLGDLQEMPLILLGENSYHFHIIVRQMELSGVTPHILLTSNQVETIKGLVTKRMGVSFLFEALTRDQPPFAVRPFAPPLFVDIGLAWKKDGHLSTAARTFVQFFREQNESI